MNPLTAYIKDLPRLNPGDSFGQLIRYELFRVIAKGLFSLTYDMRIFGGHHIPQTGPVIMISNHQSHYDPPLLTFTSRRHVYFMARSTLFSHPLFSKLISAFHAIPLDQGQADTSAMKVAIEHLRQNRIVSIFPEGGRTEDGPLKEFMPGVSLLIKRAKAPVVPIAFEGAYDVWPRRNRLPHLRGHIHLGIGPAIPYEELKKIGARKSLAVLEDRVDELRFDLRKRLRHLTQGQFPKPGPGDEPIATSHRQTSHAR